MALGMLFTLAAHCVLLTHGQPTEGWLHFEKVTTSNALPSGGQPVATRSGVRSSLECGRLCTSHHRCSCRSYGYSRELKRCRLFREDLAAAGSGGSGGVPGFSYYAAATFLGGYGAPCSRDEDCDCLQDGQCLSGSCGCPPQFSYNAASSSCKPATSVGSLCTHNTTCAGTQNVECRDGRCQCVIGYHFNPGPGTCVERCDSYGDGFYTGRGCVSDRNFLADDSRLTEDDCRSLCLQHASCRTYELTSSACNLADVTRLDHPDNWGPWCDYGVRDCA